jgi:hypothetical protein
MCNSAQEFGHAFGLLHKHQRPSRDDVLNRAAEKGHSEDQLCNSARCAAEFSFTAYQFTKNGELVDPSTGSKDYDVESIMHYTSENFADRKKFKDHRGDADYYPLVKEGGRKTIIKEPEPFRDFVVSDFDVQGIKAMNPWS